MTIFAPALAANMQRMPVPQPTSSTTLSLRHSHISDWSISSRRVNVLEEVLVVVHRVAVGQRSHFVLEHFFVNCLRADIQYVV